MNLRSMFKGLMQADMPPATIATAVVVILVLAGWIIFARTELSGAKNPPGSPGNVDPYFSGSTPRAKQQSPGGGANGPVPTGMGMGVGGSSRGVSTSTNGSGAAR